MLMLNVNVNVIRVDMIKQMIWKNCIGLTLVPSTLGDKMTYSLFAIYSLLLIAITTKKTCKTGKINSNEKQIFTNFNYFQN